MVKERLEIKEEEMLSILKHIDEGNNFLLSGGAGSGKTYSLVNIIRQVIKENPTVKIACMTYTNAAVKEIEERVNHKNLQVTTIHDFLWGCINNFQAELKKSLFELVKESELNGIKIEDFNHDKIEENGIRYKENRRLADGIISHDELLIISEYMFVANPKLCKLVQDKYRFIFIDEYQDTDKRVIAIFLKHFKSSSKNSTIGFFGDTMQSIYETGIGNLDSYKGEDKDSVREVIKKQNRRNPKLIYDLANKLRSDLKQEHSEDKNAPNMGVEGVVKQGKRLFLYSTDDFDNKKIVNHLSLNENWNFEDVKQTKILNLTHNLIATKIGFQRLMDTYDKDIFVKFLSKVRKYLKLRKISFEDNVSIELALHKIHDDVSKEILSYELKSFTILKYIESLKVRHPDYSIAIMELINNLKPIDDNRIDEDKKHFVSAFKLKTSIVEIDFIYELKIIKDLEKKLPLELYEFIKNQSFNKYKNLYLNKDMLIDDKKQSHDSESKKGSKRDDLIKHLFKIQNVLFNYQNKNYSEVIRVLKKNGKKIESVKVKNEINENIKLLLSNVNFTIEKVIEKANELGLVSSEDDRLKKYILEKEYIYNKVKDIPYQEFIKLYDYLEGFTPFSTQHKTKGAEFDNVLVMLDNGKWYDYNFEYLFTNNLKNESILKRTQKIFYVCCTRAKENLAVFFHNPNEQVITKANEWFGNDNVINLDVV